MKLSIIEPDERHQHAILICDEDHNDIAEFFHSDHATVDQTYEEALRLAHLLVEANNANPV